MAEQDEGGIPRPLTLAEHARNEAQQDEGLREKIDFAATPSEEPLSSWEDAPPDILFQAAIKAKDNNQLDAAEALFRRILDYRWDEPQVLLFLGQTLTQGRRWQEAKAVALQLLAAKPFDPDGLMLAAYCFSALQEHDAADRYHRRAMEVAPLAPVERWNWSLHCLRHGQWAEGWREYEWGATVGKRHRRSPHPAWNGALASGDKPGLSGGSLYIYPEQGFGDVFMGLRFVPLARAVGGFNRVVVEVPESMVTLVLANAARLGIDAVYATQNNGAFGEVTDHQVSVMSLPRALGLDSREMLARWVAQEPFYLAAEAVELEPVGEIQDDGTIKPITSRQEPGVPREDVLKVGVSWQGSTGHQNDGIRSIRWDDFGVFVERLIAGGAEVYSLVPNIPMEQRHPEVTYFGVSTWQDTAELVASLDLVVTVDTAVGHLAGAMGVPCNLLLAYDPDWRWGIAGEQTEWYRNHHLWRQGNGESWADVLARLGEAFVGFKTGTRIGLNETWHKKETLDAVQEAAEND